MVATFALNLGLVIAHFVVFAATHSRLVLAQGADSLVDVSVSAILAFSAWVGAKGRDTNHPFGHGRAEPVGALISSVLAGVLVLEVAKSAVLAAWAHEQPQMDASVLLVLGAKFLVKCLFIVVLVRQAGGAAKPPGGSGKSEAGPAVRAVIADSKNDLATVAASAVGYFAVRAGYPLGDSVIALFICVYIARNTYGIFRENLGLLMGEAPDEIVRESIRSAAAAVPGVRSVDEVSAHYVGSQLHVEVVVTVMSALSARDSHDVAERVQCAVEALDDVGRAFVHVDVETGPAAPRTAPIAVPIAVPEAPRSETTKTLVFTEQIAPFSPSILRDFE